MTLGLLAGENVEASLCALPAATIKVIPLATDLLIAESSGSHLH
jgi:hypothetical protein